MASVIRAASLFGFCRRVTCELNGCLPSTAIRYSSFGRRPDRPPGSAEFNEAMRRAQQLMRDAVNAFGGTWPFSAAANEWWSSGRSNIPGSHWEYEDTYVDEAGMKKWRLTMAMSCFRPQDIEVSTRNRRLHIKAKHSSIDQRQDKIKYEYERDYTLPEGVTDVKTITSKYTDDGRLVIEADYAEAKSPGRAEGEQEIPVKHN